MLYERKASCEHLSQLEGSVMTTRRVVAAMALGLGLASLAVATTHPFGVRLVDQTLGGVAGHPVVVRIQLVISIPSTRPAPCQRIGAPLLTLRDGQGHPLHPPEPLRNGSQVDA